MAEKIPKYQEIADWLKENIQQGVFPSGEKLISEPSLCEKFDISRHTARAAVSILEAEGFVTRKRGSGTYVNHFIADTERKNIGVLTTYSDAYIFPSIISGIEEVLSQKGYRMTLGFTQNKIENERSQLLSFLSDGIDGLIVEPVKSALPSINLDIFHEFTARGIPVIFINSYYNRLDCNYILNDDVLGGRLAARHLIENGHTNIGGIFKHDDIQGSYRYQGLIEELSAHHLKVQESHMIWFSTETQESLFSPAQFSLLRERLNGVSGIVCYNDQVAVKFVQAAMRASLQIPRDFSIVSFDNSNLSRVSSVPLSSITHPGLDMGRLAAQSLLKIVNTPLQIVRHVFEPELVVRDSVQNISKQQPDF